MKIALDCIPCFLRQILEATRMVTQDTKIQEKIIDEAIEIVKDYKKYNTPPELARPIYKLVKKYTGIKDPYKSLKEKSIKIAKNLYPYFKELINKKQDKLGFALKISAIGNSFDAGVYSAEKIEKISEELEKELDKEFAIYEIDKFKKYLENAKSILIIGDNAGESVFDRLFIEVLQDLYPISKERTFYAVREEPIINDVTIEDAYASDLHLSSQIISTGCDFPGVNLKECNEEFIRIFNSSDIIICKGQGNYESFSDIKKDNLFFLLKVKCSVIAKHIKIEPGNYVFKN